MTDQEAIEQQIIRSYHHIPCSLIQLLYSLREFRKKHSPEEIYQITSKSVE